MKILHSERLTKSMSDFKADIKNDADNISKKNSRYGISNLIRPLRNLINKIMTMAKNIKSEIWIL